MRRSTSTAKPAQVRSGYRISTAISCTLEAIERRVLMAADALPSRGELEHMNAAELAAAGVERIRWNGQMTYARAGEFIVKASSDHTRGTKTQTLRLRMRDTLGAKVASLNTLNGNDLYIVRTREVTSVNAFSLIAKGVKGFVRAEPNFIVWADATLPNDPSFNVLWGLHNTGQSGGTVDADIDAPETWDQTTGNGSVVVGVIDTGVDYTHPDLAANMWTNPGETAGNGIDDDGNGIIDDVYGADFVGGGDGDPMDDHYHGTHCAGTIGAVGNNGIGVAGVAWNVKIMALKFLSSSGSGTTDDAIEAINYAAAMRDRGVNIRLTSNSWGGGAFSQSLLDAINANAAKDILFVAAAGNNSSNTDLSINYPSCYDAPNILSIAALDRNDNLASFSNYGLTTVDLGAPGVDIYSTSPGNSYRTLSGTSMATPHVSGAAAMAFMVSPSANYARVKSVLMGSTVPVASLAGKSITGGRLNLLAAVRQMGLQLNVVSPAAGSVASTPLTAFTVVADADYNAASVTASDLKVNGFPADTVVLVDARTIRFEFATSPIAAEGSQTITIAADSIARLADGSLNTPLSSTFYYDPTPLVVSDSRPSLSSAVSIPLGAITFDFSEAINPATVQASDLVLGFGTASSVTIVDADTVTFALTGLSREGVLTLNMAPGSITNALGVPFAGLSSSVQLDATALPLAPMTKSEPRGVLVHETAATGSIAIAGDVDEYTQSLDAGQTLTVALTVGPSLRARVELVNPAGTVVGTAQAVAAGDVVILQCAPVATAGTYAIRLSALDSTIGTYQLAAYLNTTIEAESVGGATNNNRADAQNLDVSALGLGSGASRYAALGNAASGAQDWYSISLVAGQRMSVLATGAAGVSLYDAGGQLLALGTANAKAAAIRAYRAPTSGTYYVRVDGKSGAYQLEAGVGAAIDTNDALAAQSLSGFGAAVGSLGLSSLGRLFAFDNSGLKIREFNPTTGVVVREFNSPVSTSGDPDGGLATTASTILAGGIATSPIYEINPDTGATIRTLPNPGVTISGLAFMNNEIFIQSDNVSPNVIVLDYATGAVKRSFAVGSIQESLAATGTVLLGAGGSNLYQIDPITGVSTLRGSISVGTPEGLGVIGDEIFVGVYGSTNSITVLDLATLAYKRAFNGVVDLEGIGADGAGPGYDLWTIDVVAGDVITLSTATPGDGPGEFENLLDPKLAVYNAANVLVASNDNGSPDGHNATLSFTAATSGKFSVRVSSVSGSGAYVLNASGATGTSGGIAVASSTPANGASLVVAPSEILIELSDLVDPATVQASDLTIDGVAAASVSVVDGDTLSFTPGATITDGSHTILIASGAIGGLDGSSISGFTSLFGLLSAPRVINSSIQQDQVIATTVSSFTFDFNFALLAANLDSSDFTLVSQGGASRTVTSFNYDTTSNRLTLNYAPLTDDVWTLTLLSGSGRLSGTTGLALDGETLAWPIPPNQSGNGTPGGNFVVRFAADVDTVALPTPLTPVGASMSMAYSSTAIGSIGNGSDADSFTINLDAGQTLTAVLTPAVSLQGVIEILDSAGAVIATAQGLEAGKPVFIQNARIDANGTYSGRVSSLGTTAGTFTLKTYLNTAIEDENVGGPLNGSPATAQSLEASKIVVAPGAWRAAVLGLTNIPAGDTVRDDYYSVALAAGQSLDVLVSGALASLNVVNAAGTVLVSAVASGAQTVISGWRPAAAGTYFIKIGATANGSYDLLAGGNLLLDTGSSVSVPLGRQSSVIGSAGMGGMGRLFAFDAGSNRILELNPSNGTIIRNYASPVTASGAPDAGLATTNNSVLVGGSSTLIYEINPDTGATSRSISTGWSYSVSGLAFGNNEIYVLTDDTSSGNLQVLDYTSGAVKRTLTLSLSAFEALGFTKRGLLTTDGSSIYQVNVATGAMTQIGTPSYSVEGLANVGDELFIASGSTMAVYDINTFLFKRSYSVSMDNEGLGGDISGSGSRDYAVKLKAGVPFAAQTSTPGDGPNEFINLFNPRLQILDGAGVVVASNDDGAPDGRNALVNFTPTANGVYTVRVSGQTGDTGLFVLNVSGNEPNAGALTVTSITPANNTTLATAPTEVRLDFSDLVDLQSLTGSDLTIDGIPVSSFTVVDGNTISFSLAGLNLADGIHTIAVASGAITSIGGGDLAAFSSTFSLDLVGPRVINANVQLGDNLPVGSRTFEFTFDRALAVNSLDSSDFTLVGSINGARTPTSYTWLAAANKLTLTYANLPEDVWTLTLLSGNGRIESVVGNDLDGEATAWPIPPNQSGNGVPGGNFVVGFTTDSIDTALPVNDAPFGYSTMITVGSASGLIRDASDTDSFLLNLDAGQTLSLAMTTASTLQLGIELIAPDGTSIYTRSAATAGASVFVSDHPLTQAGTYRLVLNGLGGTAGTYALKAALNAHYEAEAFGGAGNDVRGNAEDLDPSMLSFTSATGRVAAAGSLGTSASVDYYKLTIAAGDTLDMLVTGTGLSNATVYDASGTVVAISSGNAAEQKLGELLLATGGTYYIAVSGSGDYALTAARNLLIDRTTANGNTLLGARLGALGWTSSSNTYRVYASAGELLRIETFTPAGGPGDFINTFNPRLELYNPSGTLISVNDNGNPDARNAVLVEYAAVSGLYTIRVGSTTALSTSGHYGLVTTRTTGAPVTPFTVASTSPASGAVVADPAFSTYTVNFNDLVDLRTVSGSDVTFNGVAAAAYTVIDGDSISFTLPTPADGIYSVAIAAGSISDTQGTPLDAFLSSFTLELLGPRVVFSNVQEGDLRSTAATHSLAFEFDKGLSSSVLDATDFTLVGAVSGTHAGTITYTAATRRVTLSFGNLPEDSYTLTLLSADGRFESSTGLNLDGEATAWPIPPNRSGDGVAGGNFVVHFAVDSNDVALQFAAAPLAESMVYLATASGSIANGTDLDTFHFSVDANQFVTLVLDVAPSLRGLLELFDSSGAVVATRSASLAGADVVLQSSILPAGNYSIRVTPLDGTGGGYTLRSALNSDIERGLYGGARNDSMANAQLLDSSVLSLGSRTRRGAVVGRFPVTAGDDRFRDSFESGSLGGSWTVYSSVAGGRSVVSSAYGAGAGTMALLMDTGAGTNTLNEAELTLDLSALAGRSDVSLSFAHLDLSDEDTLLPSTPWTGHASADGISFSGDGGLTWRALWNVAPAATWTNFQLNLSDAMAAAGWTFGANFKLRLQQYDNSALSGGDGRGWDNLAITTPAIADRYYSMVLPAGTKFRLAADAPAGTVFEVLDSAGTLLATSSAGGSNVDFIASANIVTGGTHYIRAIGRDGEYTLVTLENAEIDREGNNTPAAAQPMTPGSSVLGSLAFGTSLSTGGTAFTGPRDFVGSTVSLGFSANGSMIGNSIGARWGSTEMLYYGTMIGTYAASLNGTSYANNAANGTSSFSVQMYDQTAGTRHAIYMIGTITTGVTFERWVIWNDGDNHVAYWSAITNNTSSAIANVALMDVRDVDVASVTSTLNDVVQSGDLVYSVAGGGMGLGSSDPRAVVSVEGFDNRVPFDIISSPLDPDGASGDTAINLAFDFGTLAPGQTVSAGFYTVFGADQAAIEAQYLAAASSGFGATDSADVFRVTLAAGQSITLSTLTPGDGPNLFANTLDPVIEILDAGGVVVATNDNGAPDGHNALLGFVAGAGGDYYVRIKAASGSGVYVLDMATSLSATSATVEYQSRQAFHVNFSAPIDAASVASADLLVTNLDTGATFVADRVEVTGNSVAWVFDATLPDGDYRIEMAAGAVKSTAGGALGAAFVADGGDFFFVSADIDRDRDVDFDDLLTLAQNYGTTGKTFGSGNINYSADGSVDFDDLLILAQKYGDAAFSLIPITRSEISTKRRRANELVIE